MVKLAKLKSMMYWVIGLSVILILLIAFVYSPYYAKSGLWLLDRFVSQEVDPVAAESQKNGQLSAENELEPGSKEWVARQAYLAEVNQSLDQNDASKFLQLQQRYNLLLKMIAEQKQDELNYQLQIFSDNTLKSNIELDVNADQNYNSALSDTKSALNNSNIDSNNALDIEALFEDVMSDENQSLFEQYRQFLTDESTKIQLENDTTQASQVQAPFIYQRPAHQPHAIVILGGGLTSGEKKGEIVVNAYTKKRLEQAVEVYQSHNLPIVLSGVEAPYMQKWLEQHQIHAQFLENRSMNTCENTRFSSLLLQKQGGAPTVFLVTDAYHMARAKRLFAINGIATIPVIAPLPNMLTEWQPSKQNLMHSRRATYEILATMRDVWFGESNCREIP
uniref:YdcF family protein n=1 Tax=uncultured Acinetobacter sp. TaxID=165433 RepID=UPI002606800B|nr:YdcF family protein [uncultured Acinetobacter sp.]